MEKFYRLKKQLHKTQGIIISSIVAMFVLGGLIIGGIMTIDKEFGGEIAKHKGLTVFIYVVIGIFVLQMIIYFLSLIIRLGGYNFAIVALKKFIVNDKFSEEESLSIIAKELNLAITDEKSMKKILKEFNIDFKVLIPFYGARSTARLSAISHMQLKTLEQKFDKKATGYR